MGGISFVLVPIAVLFQTAFHWVGLKAAFAKPMPAFLQRIGINAVAVGLTFIAYQVLSIINPSMLFLYRAISALGINPVDERSRTLVQVFIILIIWTAISVPLLAASTKLIVRSVAAVTAVIAAAVTEAIASGVIFGVAMIVAAFKAA